MSLSLTSGKPIIDWVAQKLGTRFHDATVIGVIDDERNQLLAGICYNHYSGYSVEMSIASTSPHWCSRGVLRAAFEYPFFDLGCRRVTATTAVDNHQARKMLERLGFKLEGFHPQSMPDGKDGLSYGLLKSDCRWIGEDNE